MIKFMPIIFAIALLFPAAVPAVDDTWQFFKLYNTTENAVIMVFGTPDAVNIVCGYEDLKKAKESDGKGLFSAYALIYNRLRGDLNILKGPLGEAASTKVHVEDGKVIAVDWDYNVKYKAAAETLWKKDKSFTTKVGKAITIGKKKLPDGDILFVTCTTGLNGKCDGLIEVMLSKDPEKK